MTSPCASSYLGAKQTSSSAAALKKATHSYGFASENASANSKENVLGGVTFGNHAQDPANGGVIFGNHAQDPVNCGVIFGNHTHDPFFLLPSYQKAFFCSPQQIQQLIPCQEGFAHPFGT